MKEKEEVEVLRAIWRSAMNCASGMVVGFGLGQADLMPQRWHVVDFWERQIPEGCVHLGLSGKGNFAIATKISILWFRM